MEYGHNHPQYRLKLKNRLLKTYGDDLLFLSPNYHSAQVVISSKCLQEQNISSVVSIPDEKIVVKSADILRKSILNNIENEEKLTWPPTVEQLENEKRSPPQLLLQFLHRILHGDNNHHIIGEKKNNVGRSIADDLLYGVSRGSYLTLKHCSIGLGLHSLTGLKQPHCFTF